MTKIITDEELEQMGVFSKQMLEQAAEVWKLAMKTMPINGHQYKKVCKAGKSIQALHDSLMLIAEDREWTDEKLQTVFSRTGYSFS